MNARCLRKFFILQVFVCLSQAKINFVVLSFKVEKTEEFLKQKHFFNQRRTVFLVFLSSIKLTREKLLELLLTNDSSQIPARQGLVILIKLRIFAFISPISKESLFYRRRTF